LPLPPGDEPTEELSRVTGGRQDFRTACAGVITAAVVLLALCLLVAVFLGQARGVPGPRPAPLGAHIAGAVVAVLLYRRIRRGSRRWRAFLALVAVLALLLWFFWWAT
jgi:hypothetical protein